MALNFPDSPALNDIYTDSTSGFSYQWDGTVWKSYSSASTNNIRTLDDISGSFNGVTNSFALSVSGSAVTPANAQQLLISVGGVMQSPNTDYTISGSNIIFTTPPISGLTFFGTIIGTAVPVGITTVGDVYRQQSYAVTGVQTSFSFPAGYTVGYLEVYRNGVRLIDGSDFTATDGSSFDLTPPAQNGDDVEAVGYITASIAVANGNLTSLLVNNNAQVLGITTLGTNVGAGETALFVEGNARITGILTVGSSSVTIDGTNNKVTIGTGNVIDGSTPNQIKVGSGLTVTSSGIVVGVLTATTFVGDGTGLTGVGIGSTDSVNTTGIITASAFYGSAAGLSFPPVATTFTPANATAIGATTGQSVTIKFDQAMIRGTGTITLRKTTADGSIHQSIDAATSGSITFNDDQTAVLFSLSTLDYNFVYYLVVPSGALKNAKGDSWTGTSVYSFKAPDPVLSQFAGEEAVNVSTTSDIVLKFDQAVQKGTGDIEIRTGSASGSIAETVDVTSANVCICYGGGFGCDVVTINPTSNLPSNSDVYTVIPAGSFKNYVDGDYAGTSSKFFTTTPCLGDTDLYWGGLYIGANGNNRFLLSPYCTEGCSNGAGAACIYQCHLTQCNYAASVKGYMYSKCGGFKCSSVLEACGSCGPNYLCTSTETCTITACWTPASICNNTYARCNQSLGVCRNFGCYIYPCRANIGGFSCSCNYWGCDSPNGCFSYSMTLGTQCLECNCFTKCTRAMRAHTICNCSPSVS